MINVTEWIKEFSSALNERFADRVWFVGLQGSYARNEATENSDIDVVVIFDELSARDIEAYDLMLNTLPNRELVCGFLSGKNEIMNWEPSDLFQFYYDTKPIKGNLDELLPLIDDKAVDRSIKLGACNVFHGCVHNMLYDKSDEILRGLYKSASFVVQAICFKQTGNYARRREDLVKSIDAEDKEIINVFADLKNGGEVDFERMSNTLFEWSKKLINE